jgi:hypothetical protein
MKTIVLFLLFAPVAGATTLSFFSGATGPTVFAGCDAPLIVPTGSLIRVGTLLIPDHTDSFVEFGVSTVKPAGAFASARPGKVSGAVTNGGGEDDDSFFNGRDIYIWIYNAATQAAATGYGIFRAVGQTFPVNDPARTGDEIIVPASSFTEAVIDPRFPAGTQARVDFSAAANDQYGNGRLIILGTGCPEPRSAGLLLFTGLALARRRR